ncbi:MAG: hypothetical protein AAGA30_14935 [Planctomycetota bacterium]
MPIVYAIEHHHQLLDIWKERSLRQLNVAHVDFHCDMRGLFIDRRTDTAAWIHGADSTVDEGNFLAHAVMNGQVSQLIWVHDIPGGRAYDVGGVMFETDLGRWLPWNRVATRLAKPTKLNSFQTTPIRRWAGPSRSQWLDIDWDTFAGHDLLADSINTRTEYFLSKLKKSRFPRENVSVCYSPGFSHDSRKQYERFIESIAKLLDADVEQIPFVETTPPPNNSIKRILPRQMKLVVRRSYIGIQRKLRQVGVYL